jgi:hypothetical protein
LNPVEANTSGVPLGVQPVLAIDPNQYQAKVFETFKDQSLIEGMYALYNYGFRDFERNKAALL